MQRVLDRARGAVFAVLRRDRVGLQLVGVRDERHHRDPLRGDPLRGGAAVVVAGLPRLHTHRAAADLGVVEAPVRTVPRVVVAAARVVERGLGSHAGPRHRRSRADQGAGWRRLRRRRSRHRHPERRARHPRRSRSRRAPPNERRCPDDEPSRCPPSFRPVGQPAAIAYGRAAPAADRDVTPPREPRQEGESDDDSGVETRGADRQHGRVGAVPRHERAADPGAGSPTAAARRGRVRRGGVLRLGRGRGRSVPNVAPRPQARGSEHVQRRGARRDDPRRRRRPVLRAPHRARRRGSRVRDGRVAEGRARPAREAVRSRPVRVARHSRPDRRDGGARDDPGRDGGEHGGTHARSRTHGSRLERDPEPGGSAPEERSSRRPLRLTRG